MSKTFGINNFNSEINITWEIKFKNTLIKLVVLLLTHYMNILSTYSILCFYIYIIYINT
jgi:hypothetical protein